VSALSLSPVVEDDELVFHRDVRGEQVPDGRDNSAGCKVAATVIVAANDQYARMRSTGMQDKIVKFFEVIVIRG